MTKHIFVTGGVASSLGKGLTGGYLPMSATVASRRVFDAFLGPDLSERTFYHGHSYSGNALAGGGSVVNGFSNVAEETSAPPAESHW